MLVLVVDGDVAMRRVLAIGLHAHGHVVEAVSGAADALEAASKRLPSVALVDLDLRGGDGLELSSRLGGRIPVIVTSAARGDDLRRRAEALGASSYLSKPFGIDDLMARLTAAADGNVTPPFDAPPASDRSEREGLRTRPAPDSRRGAAPGARGSA